MNQDPICYDDQFAEVSSILSAIKIMNERIAEGIESIPFKLREMGVNSVSQNLRSTPQNADQKKDKDITECIGSGDLDHIISVLKRWREIGYDRLFFDGYEASIYLHKSSEVKVNLPF